MAINTCTPDNVFGPLQHTLFLGCSVSSFNATAGFNEQVAEVTITLTPDLCEASAESPKHYWDSNLQHQTTTAADPGFMGEVLPIIGCPAYFRMNDFEFCGIIQSWEKEVSAEANPGYVVKLVTPIRILQNTQLIIGEYSGPLYPNNPFANSPHNLINVYGYAESINGISCPMLSQTSPGFYDFGDTAPDGAVFGTAGGGYGGAGANENGMQWYTILGCLNVLTSAVPKLVNNWSPHGRITHKGVNLGLYGAPWTNGYGLMGYDSLINASYTTEYFIDLSELPVPPSYFRFNGVTINLMEAISRVCRESGYDFYIEMLPVNNPVASPSGIAKLIKVRALNRITQPTNLDNISEFIANAESNSTLKSSSIGRELRDDITTTFLLGGPKQSLYQAYQNYDPDGDGQPPNPEDDDMILPYFGVDSSGNMIVPYIDSSGYWRFEADTTALNLSLQELQLVNPTIISERELTKTSAIGTWTTYIKNALTDTYTSISGEWPDVELDNNKVKTLIANSGRQLSARDVFTWKTSLQDTQDQSFKRRKTDQEKIYEWVSNFANEYYGKKFAVRVPYSCAVLDPESLIVTYSEQPTNDGGWTEVADVLGMPNGTVYTDFFTNDQNKIQALVAYNTASDCDISALDPSDYIIYDDTLYLKATVDENYVFHNKNSQLVPRVVVSIGNMVQESEDSSTTLSTRIGAAFKAFIEEENLPISASGQYARFAEIYRNNSAASIYDHYGKLTFMPDAVAIPMKSNVNNYGPWVSVGPAGGVRVEKNDGLVPWQYGGFTELNLAGQALADAGNTNMQVTELGSVSVAGYPELPLGAEINSLAALGGKQLYENRSSSYGTFNGNLIGGTPFSYQYMRYDYGFLWNGTYGPNVSNISIVVGQEITTTYTMRLYTPQFGVFAELNAQRLSQIGQNRMSSARELRAFLYQRERINSNKGIGGSDKNTFNTIKQRADAIRKAEKGLTPHEMLVGQLTTWATGQKRALVSTESIREAIGEMQSGAYQQKAFMSMDGLIRPISLNGYGGLPRFMNASGSGSQDSTAQRYIMSTGLVITGVIGSSGTGIVITNKDLNPFFNPAGYAWSELAAKHTGTLGHDIDVLARGTGVPDDGMILRHKDNGSGYDYRDDYGAFALRGPVLLQSWGYTQDGKPVPNEVHTETEASGGNFRPTGLTDKFMPDFGQKSHCWPVAPIDFRLDISRGVWTLASNESEIYCQLVGHLSKYAPVPAIILESGSYFYESGTSGNITGYTVISGYTNTDNIYASGTRVKLRLNQSLARYEVNSTSHVTVLATGTISGAEWDRNITGIKPYVFSMPAFTIRPVISGSGAGWLMYETGNPVTGWNRYTDSISISNGQGKLITLINGWVDNGSCQAVTI